MNDLSSFPVTRKWPAKHPERLQLYSLPTPNGVQVSIMLEELGWAPSGLRWIVPIVALAVGVVAGVALKRNLPRLRGDAPAPRRRR